ncbi:transcription regulator hth arac- type [Lucifera butyrica]|uniref:Transcription regulator hth arac- type n=1 Tax=Lucifera butyrica TaxID=1351585 RepID=A0A498R3J6_9FIRM|nr:AraC family transcriptional regulator [Lucifera butyrica]VBB07236.1 transcription regulator hth arac- type [Lucifera butyrica]
MDKAALKENRIHGSEMFPLATYIIECSAGEKILDCHWHDEWEFLLVTAGKAVFQIETSYYELQAGQAIFVNGGSIHAGYPCHNSFCTYRAIVFDPTILNSNSFDIIQTKFIDPFLTQQLVLPTFIDGQSAWERKVMDTLWKIIQNCADSPQAYELAVKAELLLILAEFIKNSRFFSRDKLYLNNYKSDQMKKILCYIHEHYNEKITVRELCKLVGVSEGHFCRFFKHMMRKTPVEYINSYRINHAAQILRESNRKIIEVAMNVGFDNLSYFHSLFKKQMKCTPAEYRKKQAEREL